MMTPQIMELLKMLEEKADRAGETELAAMCRAFLQGGTPYDA